MSDEETSILEEGDQPELCTLLKQKGEVRTWIDPGIYFLSWKKDLMWNQVDLNSVMNES